jgi:lysophospholipase L1-like esterase
LASLLPALGLLALLEVGLRVTGRDFSVRTLKIEYEGPRADELMRMHLTDDTFVPDPQLFWRPRPGHPPFNARGWRGPELGAGKAPGEYRILAVGDSNTIGHATTWVDELGRLDPALFDARSISVVNAGVYGYTSYQGKLRLREFLGMQPDLVLISFGGNDATPNIVADKDQPRAAAEPWWSGRSRLLDALRYYGVKVRRARAHEPHDQPVSVPRVSLDDYVANLDEMVSQVRAAGAVPLLLTRPIAFDYRATESRDPLKAYMEETIATAARLGVGLVDVDTIANHTWSLYADHSHFNVYGHRVVGERVARAVVALLREGRYDLAALRYEAREPFERLTDLLHSKLNPWATLAANVAKLTDEPELPPVGEPWELDFGRMSAAWRLSAPFGTDAQPRGRALCFETSAAGPLTLMITPPERPAYGLVWVEVSHQGALEVRLFWSVDESFSEEAVAGSLFLEDQAPRALVQPLPLGVHLLRVDFHQQNAPAPACLERFVVLPIGPPMSQD